MLRSRTCLRFWRRSMCTPPPPKDTSQKVSIANAYSPSEFQKRLLVWTKKFKTRDDIPKYISRDLIDRTQSEARIKIANILMLLTALASVGAIFSGKAAAKRGESIQKINQDFHQQYRDEYEKNKADKAN